MDLEQIDTLLNWKLDGYINARHMAKEGSKMQDQITIELRVDFADKEKIPELIKIACAAARHMVANVQLLQPVTKPQCVVFTDNFMSPPESIDIFGDMIGAGQAQLKAIADSGVSGAVTAEVTAAEDAAGAPSQEMLDAMKE